MTSLLEYGTTGSLLICIALFIATVWFSLYYLLYLRQLKRWKESNIPFSPPTFLLGNKQFLSFTKNSVTVSIDKLYNENQDKGVLGFFIGALPVILIKDTNLIQDVFVKNFKKTFQPAIGATKDEDEVQYIINTASDPTIWKFARSVLLPILTPTYWAGSRFESIRKGLEEMLHHVDQTQVDGSGSINITNVTEHFVFNTIVCPSFGIQTDSEDARALKRVQRNFLDPSGTHLFGLFLRMQGFRFFKLFSTILFNTLADTLKLHDGAPKKLEKENYNFIEYFHSVGGMSVLRTDNNKAEQHPGYEGIYPYTYHLDPLQKSVYCGANPHPEKFIIPNVWMDI